MSAENKQDDLKSFEAALAGLVPRTDRLDHDRLMFLAGQQSMLPSPFGRGTEGEGRTMRKRAWHWPAAFAAMTAVAATLFVMLVFRPGAVTVENVAKSAASDASLADNAKESTDADKYADDSHGNRSIINLAVLSATNNHKSNGTDSTYSYTRLLNQIIDKGVDSWKPRATGSYDKRAIDARPQSNRELMKQLLDQIGSEPS